MKILELLVIDTHYWITKSIISYQIHTKIFFEVDIFNNRHANTVAFGVRVTKALITIVITW